MVLALISILMVGVVSGEISPEINQQLDNLIEESIHYEYEEIPSDSISGVVDASFIQVKIFQLHEKDCHSIADCSHFSPTVIKSGETIAELTGPDVLLPYIASDFQLNSESSAGEFEEMLDLLFPVFYSSGKEIYQENDTWVFIREESFGDKVGIIVQVDGQGNILSLHADDAVERNNDSGENGEVER